MPGEAVSVPAVAQGNGQAAAVFQFAEDGQALAQHRDRRVRVAVVAVHDGELPHGPGLPAAVAEPTDGLKSLGYAGGSPAG